MVYVGFGWAQVMITSPVNVYVLLFMFYYRVGRSATQIYTPSGVSIHSRI
jgi:hypothetical protein